MSFKTYDELGNDTALVLVRSSDKKSVELRAVKNGLTYAILSIGDDGIVMLKNLYDYELKELGFDVHRNDIHSFSDDYVMHSYVVKCEMKQGDHDGPDKHDCLGNECLIHGELE